MVKIFSYAEKALHMVIFYLDGKVQVWSVTSDLERIIKAVADELQVSQREVRERMEHAVQENITLTDVALKTRELKLNATTKYLPPTVVQRAASSQKPRTGTDNE